MVVCLRVCVFACSFGLVDCLFVRPHAYLLLCLFRSVECSFVRLVVCLVGKCVREYVSVLMFAGLCV